MNQALIFCGVSTNPGEGFSLVKIKLESEISEIFQLEVVKKQHFKEKLISRNRDTECSVSEFNEFELRLKSAKTRVQLNAGLNLEKLITILSGTNHI